MKKLDFLPNRQNKYSIRKFTVGTVSILLGTILISGVTEEAKAAETTSNDTTATASDSITNTSNIQGTDKSKSGTTESTTKNEIFNQPVNSSKDASVALTTQAPLTSTSNQGETIQKQAPTSETTQLSRIDNQTSTSQTPVAAPAPENKPKSPTNRKVEKDVVDATATQPQSNTKSSDINTSLPTSGTSETLTAVPDTNKATLSVPLTQDVKSSLKDAKNQTQALTDYLTKQNNLSPKAAQQVVDGMNVDLSNATSNQISNALLASYLKNSQNAPGSNQVADTSTTQATTQSKTSPISSMLMASMAAVQTPATQVGTWDEYVAAMNDKSVSSIQFVNDITANKLGTLNSDTGRTVTVDGNGHTLDTGNYYINAPVSSGNWNITLENTKLKTNHPEGFINFVPSTSTNNTLTLRNVTHTGTNIIDDTSNINNVKVNLEGNVTSVSNDNAINRATIGAKNIYIAPKATVDMTRTGLGSAFRVSDNGSITTGTGSTVNVDVSTPNPWGVSNGNTAFESGNNVTVQLGNNSTTNVKGQSIFDFGNGGTLNTGIGSTVNVDQKGNGNIVNMGTGSTFEVAKDAKFIAHSDGHRIGDWQANNLIGLDGNSQILVDENATLFLDAKNHQWNPDTQTQVGVYNDLVNINAIGNQTALLHVADNATLDLRTDNRNYYAEIISIPLAGTNPNRRYIFDHAYYVNLQKTSKVTSGQSPNGQKPNLIFMDPASPGYFQWNGSYIVKTWAPMVFSNPNQNADATDVWKDVVDLRAEQKGFSTGIPTYNEAESTLMSTSGKPLNKLNLNYAQRLVLISNNSKNPEAVPTATKTETIPPNTTYQPNPDPTKPVGTKTVITPGKPGEQTVTTEPGKDPVIKVTTPPVTEVVGVNNQKVETTPIPYKTINRYNPKLPVGAKDVLVQEGKDGLTTTTTTYDVDPKTGKLTNPQTKTETTPAVDRITEYGPVEGGTIYQPDSKLPYGKTEKIPGKPGNPNDPKNPPTDTVIHVGNVEKTTKDIPYDTTYVGVDEPVGYTNVATPGKDGSTTTTTTYEVDPKTGELTNPTSTTETVKPVTQVNQVGTKKVETTPIPYKTINRYNPKLPVGAKDVLVQEGKDGLTTATTTYDVDPKTGELTNPQTKTETTPAIDRITEYGPVEGGTIYQPDSKLPYGKTEKIPGKPGNPNDPKNPPTDTVIHVGNVEKTTKDIPYDTTYVGVDEPVGYTNVATPGKDGSTTTTTTYEVDPKTGELTNPTSTTETVKPVTQVNQVGTKKVTTSPVPYKTIIRYNPDLPVDTQKEIQPGITGETTTTTTYNVDPATGKLEKPTSNTVTTIEKQDRIIEVGTGTTSVVNNPIPNETTYEPNPDPTKPVGVKTVITPGKPGVETVTTEPGKKPVTKVTTAPVTEVVGVNNQKVESTPIPYKTITRYNPDLPAGTQKEIQPGITGETTTTTTYNVDPATGKLEKPTSNTVTTIEKQDRIIEVGTGTTSVVNNPIPNETTYEPNPDPTKPVGTKTVIKPGKPGVETITTEPGKNPVTKVTTAPVTEVIGVNNQKVESTPIPYKTINRYNPKLPVGAKDVLVQEGKDGLTTTTTTYDVDPKTGKLTNPQTRTETTPAVDRITEYGPVEGGTIYQPDSKLPYGKTEKIPGKPGNPNDPNNLPTDTVIHVGNKVVDESEVPYKTIYRNNPKLPIGTEKEIQPGVTGKIQHITTYDVDSKTGKLTNPRTETVTVIEKQDRIIERGTGNKTPTQPKEPSKTPAQPKVSGKTLVQSENLGETPATSGVASNDSAPTPSKENQTDKLDKDVLPDTGDNSSNGTLFGTLFAGLGAMLLLGKKRRRKDEK